MQHDEHALAINGRQLFTHKMLVHIQRLNIRAGANTERQPQTIRPGQPETLEFDLFHAQFFEGAVEAAWIDLIITTPEPGRIVIRDLVLSRRPRPAL